MKTIKVNLPELQLFHNKTFKIKNISEGWIHIREFINGIYYDLYIRENQTNYV